MRCTPPSVYGPSHEERSIFLQVPAVASSVHPRDLEDPFLLRKGVNFVNIYPCGTSVHLRWRMDAYFVHPFKPRNLTGVDLFLQPRPHPHSFNWHCGLQHTRTRCQIKV
uniref:Uncharacterized protein n=1 Tax=Oryzias melastigma TaxID=30732 RepID=A0A3B3DVT4_ORYME